MISAPVAENGNNKVLKIITSQFAKRQKKEL